MSNEENPLEQEPEDQTTEEQRELLKQLRDEAQQALADGQPQPPPEDHGYDIPVPEDTDGRPTHDCEFVFVTYYDREAGAVAVAKTSLAVIEDNDGSEIRLVPRREASTDDMWRSAAEVAKDIEVSQTASQTANAMLQVTQAMQQQMAVQRQQQQEAAKEAQRLSEAARRR